MKKNSKQLLFERMHTIGGMPMKEESKLKPIEVSDEDYNKAMDILEKGVDPSWDRRKRGEMFIGVTGKYQVYYTLWKYTGFDPEFPNITPKVIYLGNLSTDIVQAAEKAKKVSGKQPIELEDVDTIKGMAGMPPDVIGFGKYRGRGLGEVYVEDPQYVIWIANNFVPRNKKQEEFVSMAKSLADDYFNSMTEKNVAAETKDYFGKVGDLFQGDLIITSIKYYISDYGESFGIKAENDQHRFVFYVPRNKFINKFNIEIKNNPEKLWELSPETKEKIKQLNDQQINIKGKVKGHKDIVGKKYTQLNYVKFL
jgi:hypothetical protein